MLGVLASWFFFIALPLLDSGKPISEDPDRLLSGPLQIGRWAAVHILGRTLVEDSGSATARTAIVAGAFLALLGAFWGQCIALYRCRDTAPSNTQILLMTVVFSIPYLLSDFLLSPDVYSYISNARITAVHHGNPYLQVPASFPDELTRYIPTPWRYLTTAYGPGFELMSAGIAHLARALGGSAAAYLTCYKLWALVSHLACAALIGRLLARSRPRYRALGMAAFAWNPLFLAESAWNAHNDAFFLLFIVAGIAAFAHRREKVGMALLGVSVAIKWVSILLIPLALAYVFRASHRGGRRWARVLGAAACAGMALPVLIVPFWAGGETLLEQRRQLFRQFTNNSLGDLILTEVGIAQWRAGESTHPNEWIGRAAKPVIRRFEETGRADWAVSLPHPNGKLYDSVWWVARVFLMVIWGLALWRARDLETFVVGASSVLFAYVAVASLWFYPWYVTWAAGVACLIPTHRLCRAALCLSVTGWLVYFAEGGFLGEWGWRARALLVFVPSLLVLLLPWRSYPSARPDTQAGSGWP